MTVPRSIAFTTDVTRYGRSFCLERVRDMVRIRRLEERCAQLYGEQKIRGFLHLVVGEEAVAAGVMPHLQPQDKVVATYREHGHALLRGVSMNAIMAEMYGKREGCSRGRGGSMHLFDRATNFYGGNAIVGGGLPLATGLALADRLAGRTGCVTACFFGDGASNEGAFHESLNLASVWNLPVVYVCENNEFAESTPRSQHQKIKDVAIRAQSYNIPSAIVDGNNVEAVYLCAREAIQRARSGGGPTLVEAKTTRWRGHHEADNQSYRDKEEFQAALHNDAVARWGEELLKRGVSQSQLDEIHARVEKELNEAIEYADKSPLPDPADARADIFTPFKFEEI